jgi:hypothetical protein
VLSGEGGLLDPVRVITVLVVGALCSWLGWRSASKRIYRRSLNAPEIPPGMTRREFDRQRRRRTKVWRIVWTGVYFAVGAALAWLLLGLAVRR